MVNILMSKHFQNQWQVVGIQQQLRHVLELENIFQRKLAGYRLNDSSCKLTRPLEPLQ